MKDHKSIYKDAYQNGFYNLLQNIYINSITYI